MGADFKKTLTDWIWTSLGVLAIALGWSAFLLGAEQTGDLYQIGIALNQEGMRGFWKPIGKPEGWKGVRAGAILNDRLYTADKDGSLRVTKLDNGERRKIGGPDFGGTKMMFAAADSLWTIELDGSLYRINPTNGAWSPVGKPGALSAARAGAILKGQLYTAEINGSLQATNLSSGARTRIGSEGFGSAVHLLAAGDDLWMFDTAGSLYRVDAKTGARDQVGQAEHRKSLLDATIVQDQLYSIRIDGTLHEAKLPGGKELQIGKPDFAATRHLFADKQQLYTIETDGTLYEVFLHPVENVDAWDCFPREFEKVFQDQAKSLYRQEHPRQLLEKGATHQAIMDEFARLKSQVTAKDVVVLYYTSHGGTDPEKGWSAGTADNQILWGTEIKRELAKLPCHALVFLETCNSGSFIEPYENTPLPANVTVLCSCKDNQVSSNELDIASLEALWGRADFNHDGVVDLDELTHYVDARYKTMFRQPNQEGQLLRPVIVKGKNMPGTLKLTTVSPKLGGIVHNGYLYGALINDHEGSKYHVHILGFNNQTGAYFVTSQATRDCVCLPSEGPPLEVEQNGIWFPARLISKVGDRFKVHYLGFQEDEVVTRQRVRRAFVSIPEADERLKN